MDGKPRVSVIIPAYNEAQTIGSTVDRVRDHLVSLEDRYEWEIVVVDDGSTDGTGDEAIVAGAGDDRVRVLAQPSNFNLGQSLRYGFSVARGDYLVTLDADLSYDPTHIERLVEVLETTPAKVVTASPYMSGGSVTGVPTSRLVASRMANRFLSRAAKGDLTTITGIVRGYDARFLRRLDLKAMDAEINAEIIYKAQLMRARIAEIPGHLVWTRNGFEDRPFRPSRSTAAFMFLTFLFRPYAFFLFPAAMTTIAAIVAWVIALTGPSDDAVVAAAAATLTLVAAILSGFGVISAQAKRYFEELWHIGATSPVRDVVQRRTSTS